MYVLINMLFTYLWHSTIYKHGMSVCVCLCETCPLCTNLLYIHMKTFQETKEELAPQSADFLYTYVERLRTYLSPNISERQGTCFNLLIWKDVNIIYKIFDIYTCWCDLHFDIYIFDISHYIKISYLHTSLYTEYYTRYFHVNLMP